MNKRGQALVEFILIMPLLLFIIMSMIDVSNIFLNKYELNKNLEEVTELYQSGDRQKLLAYTSNEDIIFNEEMENNINTITIKKEIKINAPILTNVIGKKYIIKTSKKIYGEQNE